MRIAVTALVLCLLASEPIAAWEGALKTAVRPIGSVVERAEPGDLVAVQGEITRVEVGSGSRYIVTLDDGTGSVLVRVPEHLLRRVAAGDSPQVGITVRVGGKWTQAYLDDQTWGIHAQAAEAVEEGEDATLVPADEAPTDCPGFGCRRRRK